jgi:hypothetical protein
MELFCLGQQQQAYHVYIDDDFVYNGVCDMLERVGSLGGARLDKPEIIRYSSPIDLPAYLGIFVTMMPFTAHNARQHPLTPFGSVFNVLHSCICVYPDLRNSVVLSGYNRRMAIDGCVSYLDSLFDVRTLMAFELWSKGTVQPMWIERPPMVRNLHHECARKVATVAPAPALSRPGEKVGRPVFDRIAYSRNTWPDLPKQAGSGSIDGNCSGNLEQRHPRSGRRPAVFDRIGTSAVTSRRRETDPSDGESATKRPLTRQSSSHSPCAARRAAADSDTGSVSSDTDSDASATSSNSSRSSRSNRSHRSRALSRRNSPAESETELDFNSPEYVTLIFDEDLPAEPLSVPSPAVLPPAASPHVPSPPAAPCVETVRVSESTEEDVRLEVTETTAGDIDEDMELMFG